MKKTILYLCVGLVIAAVGIVAYGEFASKFSGNKDGTLEVKQALDLNDYETAVFSGGCFWCTESDFEKTDGVVEAISGYTGGQTENPTYEQTNTGTTGHREAVQVYYDPAVVTYAQLLEVFWRHHDPTDAGGSFGDRGHQYTSALYYEDDAQKAVISSSIEKIQGAGVLESPVATKIEELGAFYVAEDYHQDYYTKNPTRYRIYRGGSGRDAYIQKTWGQELERVQHHTQQQ